MPGTSPGNIFTWKTIIAGLFYQLVVRAVFQTKGQIGSCVKLQKFSKPPVSCPELTSKQFLRTAFLPNLPGRWIFQNQVLPLITPLGRNSFCCDIQSAKAGGKWMSAFMLQQPLLLCRFDLFHIQLWSILLSTLHILSSAIYKSTMRSSYPQCTRLTNSSYSHPDQFSPYFHSALSLPYFHSARFSYLICPLLQLDCELWVLMSFYGMDAVSGY